MAPIADLEFFRLPPRWLFVKITDVQGKVGWGEATLEGHTLSIEATLTSFRSRLLHNANPSSTSSTSTPFDCDAIEYIFQSLYRQGFYRGGPVLMSALSGIDIALWDLKARRLGVPIHELLGGRVRDRIKVYSWIGGDQPASPSDGAGTKNLISQARERKTQGFTAVKMNATSSVAWLDSPSLVDDVVSRVRAVKKEGLDVALDFHGRLHRPMAKQLAKALESERPLFIEEPLLSEHPESIAQLSNYSSTPIALGERLYGRNDAKRFLSPPSGGGPIIDILQPDISHCGGISELHRLASLAETFDVSLAPHCPLGPLALAACMQVDMCSVNFVIQEMSVGMHYNVEAASGSPISPTFSANPHTPATEEKDDEEEDVEEDAPGYDIHSYIKNPEVWRVSEDGYVDALTGPGLGVEVDEDAVRRVSDRYVRKGLVWETARFWGRGDGEVREW